MCKENDPNITAEQEYIPTPLVDDELDWENGPENENEEEES